MIGADTLSGQTVLDRAISWISPSWGATRMRARAMIRMFSGAYESAHPSRLQKWAVDYGSGTNITRWAHLPLRIRARDLERNSDLAQGALSVLVRNTVGPYGIGIEPSPKRADGTVHDDLAQAMHRVWRNWQRRPEVTRSHNYGSMQRLTARSWYRDGEVLKQQLMGSVPGLIHATKLPFSQELIECDQLPVYLDDESRGITQGVQRNAWLQPTGYWLYKGHPGDYQRTADTLDMKMLPASNILHLKMMMRIAQVRGISLFGAVIPRLLDVKDYEDSERIAAKVAANLCAVITTGTAEDYVPPTDAQGHALPANQQSQMHMAAGSIFRLAPGQDVSTIDSKRPNPQVESFRSGQLRAAAAGLEISYSSFSKNYNGTYSAQRQELVEQYGAYGVLSAEFISVDAQPTYEAAMNVAFASGAIDLRKFPGFDPESLLDAFYVMPPMPWINPVDEVEAMQAMEESCYMSAPEIIRRRGAHPDDVLRQEAAWRGKASEQKVHLAVDNPAPPSAPRPMNRVRHPSMPWS